MEKECFKKGTSLFLIIILLILITILSIFIVKYAKKQKTIDYLTNEDINITLSGPIIVDSNNNTIVLTRENIKDYYGMKVKNYTAGDASYRLFYVDFDGKFGDKDVIYLKADYDTSRKICAKTNSNWSDVNMANTKFLQMNPKLKCIKENEHLDISNIKAYDRTELVAIYLCTPNNWNAYLDIEKADFAIASPSLEMYIESYNQVPHITGNNKLDSIAKEVFSYSENAGSFVGYELIVNEQLVEEYESNILDNNEYNQMYCSKEKYWLSTPSCVTWGIFTLYGYSDENANGKFTLNQSYWFGTEIGYCPLIALKSTFKPILVVE